MNKLSCLTLVLCLASAPALHAADPKPEVGFWEMLRLKIEMLTPQKKLSTTTAVGGVRGAPIEVNDIYWKGETKPQEIPAEELASFSHALALADAGKKEEAKLAFSGFSRTYPSSTLRESADQALAQLMLTP